MDGSLEQNMRSYKSMLVKLKIMFHRGKYAKRKSTVSFAVNKLCNF